MNVMFLRVAPQIDEKISAILFRWYTLGWRVVSHADADGEYSFVLEKL